jgi:hypothetical protein
MSPLFSKSKIMEGDNMATISLNVYTKEDKSKVEKTYTAESYDLMLGTVEELMQLIDVDKMTDNIAIAKMVVQGYSKLKPFVKDIFPGITDDELNRVKVKELIPTFVQVFATILDDLDLIKTGN